MPMGWDDLAMGVGSWLAGSFVKASNYSTQADMLGQNISYLEQSINKVNEQKKVLSEAFKLERGNIVDEYGMQYKNMLTTYDYNKGKSGFEYSGTLEDKEDFAKEQMEAGLGKQLGDWETRQATTMSNLDIKTSDLNFQKAQAQLNKNYAENHSQWWQNLFG